MTTIEEYIDAQPENLQPILHELRQLILITAPEFQESLKWGMPNYGLKKNICYLAAQKDKYVNFGFHEANLLHDAENLLEGTGAKMRHIKVYSLADIKTEAFQNLILQSLEQGKAKPVKKAQKTVS
ncbi:DUF1801 domain-containing protein [Adhaeribacter terreus]|uniref:DUF1801 domain-containing protein n=1 Tax=Adhaeribacter terreus TaxID=529703 RepID=A0ABW0E957_9BACT